MQPTKYKQKLKFYADTAREKNHLFTWRVSSRERALRAIKHFQGLGWVIRAAWYQKFDSTGVRVVNEQIYSAKKMDTNGLIKKGSCYKGFRDERRDERERREKNEEEEQREIDYYERIREADRETDWKEAPIQPKLTEDDLPF